MKSSNNLRWDINAIISLLGLIVTLLTLLGGGIIYQVKQDSDQNGNIKQISDTLVEMKSSIDLMNSIRMDVSKQAEDIKDHNDKLKAHDDRLKSVELRVSKLEMETRQ